MIKVIKFVAHLDSNKGIILHKSQEVTTCAQILYFHFCYYISRPTEIICSF